MSRLVFWALLATALCAVLLGLSAHADAAAAAKPMSICFALREGASLASIEIALLEQGYSDRDAGTLTGQTVRDHCPDLTQSVLTQARAAMGES